MLNLMTFMHEAFPHLFYIGKVLKVSNIFSLKVITQMIKKQNPELHAKYVLKAEMIARMSGDVYAT